MSLYYSGGFTRSGGIISAIAKQIKSVNLKPVKKIEVQFDPFHPKAIIARDFLYHISTPKVSTTNLNCIIKANVVCDRSEPLVKVDLIDNKGCIKFLADNLTTLEILKLFNKHISSKVEPDEVVSDALLKIKSKKIKRK